jgi:hypothetical protein
MKNSDNQKISVLGEITANFYDQSTLTEEDRKFNKAILNLREKYPEVMKHYRLGELKTTDKHKNVICNAGFAKITEALGNNEAKTIYINKMALGTGTGTPAATDTTLFTESYRNDTASGTDVSNVLYLTAYYTETECDGTYTEFGNFIGGTASADSGSLWSHIAGLNWVKSDTVVLVVSAKYTFASV